MKPTKFKECNCTFSPPKDLDESQCCHIHAYGGTVKNGSVDGAQIVVVAWVPSPEELKDLNDGKPVFLSMIGGLAPHIVGTSFEYVTQPV